jgi:hypothetical protein
MRIDDFDSQWHFVPDRPEAIQGFRRTNRVMFVFFALFVVGVFVSMMVLQPLRNAVTATHFGTTLVQKAKVRGPNHPAPPSPQTR